MNVISDLKGKIKMLRRLEQYTNKQKQMHINSMCHFGNVLFLTSSDATTIATIRPGAA